MNSLEPRADVPILIYFRKSPSPIVEMATTADGARDRPAAAPLWFGLPVLVVLCSGTGTLPTSRHGGRLLAGNELPRPHLE